MTVSAALVVGSALAFAAAGLTSSRGRDVSYSVRGALDGIKLDLGDANVVVMGAGQRTAVQVQRHESFAFGHGPRTRRTVMGRVFQVRSRCPGTVLHSCGVSYRVAVPDNVPVDVATSGGTVRLSDYRGSARVTTGAGDIEIQGFCGFSLRARSSAGSVQVGAACAPQVLSLRSTTGDVHASVPEGRYQVDAESASGSRSVRGVTSATDAPFTIQALSSSGDVLVEGRP